MKENFINAEKRERKAIDWFINSNPIHRIDDISPIGNFASNDFKFWSGNTHIVGEVKIRDFASNQYPTAIIDMDKISRILIENEECHRLYRSQFFYFAFYPKSRDLLVFDVKNTPSTITYEYTRATTMDPTSPYRYKPMLNFKVADAIIRLTY